MELRWNAVTGAVRYDLRSYTVAGGWEFLGGDNLTATTFTHNDLNVGTKYYYWIRALPAEGSPSLWTPRQFVLITSVHTPTATATTTPTPTPTATPSPTPTATPSALVQRPPGSLHAHPYYTKYLDAAGIPIMAPAGVSDEELYQTRTTILAMVSDRPDVLKTMVEHGFRVLIYPDRFEKGGRLVDLPEFSNLNMSPRVIGAAGRTPYGWVAGAPEVARHCNHTMIHEFAHLIEDALRLKPGGEEFMNSLNSAYQAAILRGLWQDRYASTNALEYWAELVRAWLTPSEFAGWIGPGYQKLEDYDPVGAALVAAVLGNPTPLPFCEVRQFNLRGTLELSGSQSSTPLNYVMQLSMRAPGSGKRLQGTTTAVGRSDSTFAFDSLIVENHFLDTAGEKPHMVLGIFLYASAGNAACPIAAFLGNDETFVRSTDAAQWKKFEVTGNHITGLALSIPSEFDWTPLHVCI